VTGIPVAILDGMVKEYLALARDPRFIPLVYDYCDMWCERCPITGRCLLFAAKRLRPPAGADVDGEDPRVADALALGRAVIDASGPAERPIAKLDLALCDVATAPREPALGHPLEYLARHYAIQAAEFLRPLQSGPDGRMPRGSPLEVLAWDHFLIAAKIYRALVSQHGAALEAELLKDALGSAKIALLAIDRSLAAWHTIASTDDDARIGGLIELLEALRTGVELRFPDARTFHRPGLDGDSRERANAACPGEPDRSAQVSARAIEAGGSGDGYAGERP
jgi:hypothetical protein